MSEVPASQEATSPVPAPPSVSAPPTPGKQLKVWIKRLGTGDDEALKVLMDEDADVSDVIQASFPLFSFGEFRASDLQIMKDEETPVSNRDPILPIVGGILLVRPRESARPATAPRPKVSTTPASAPIKRPPLPKPAVPTKPTVTAVKRIPPTTTRGSKTPATTATVKPSPSAKTSSVTAGRVLKATATVPVGRKPAAALPATPEKRSTTTTAMRSSTPPGRRQSPSKESLPTAARGKATARSSSVGAQRNSEIQRSPPVVPHCADTSIQKPSQPACGKFSPSWGLPMTCNTCKQHKNQHTGSGPAKPLPSARHSAAPKTSAVKKSGAGSVAAKPAATNGGSATKEVKKPVHFDPVVAASPPVQAPPEPAAPQDATPDGKRAPSSADAPLFTPNSVTPPPSQVTPQAGEGVSPAPSNPSEPPLFSPPTQSPPVDATGKSYNIEDMFN